MSDDKLDDHVQAARTAVNDAVEALERLDAELEAVEDIRTGEKLHE